MRRLLVLSILLLALAAGAAAERPPSNLRFTGDHWTAWDPPTEFPEGAQLYLIERGDTLWDLAGRFYGDPYLWPQIWEQNRYILDAHWIYPGDPLVVGIEVTPIEEIAPLPGVADVGAAGDDLDDRFATASGAPEALGSTDDIFCSGYIGPLAEEFEARVAGSEYGGLDVEASSSWSSRRTFDRREQPLTAKLGLVLGDIVYLDRGEDAGLLPGSLYMALRVGDKVRHIDSGAVLGRLYHHLGRVRLLSVQETTAIAEIVHSCYPIEVGIGLKPFADQPIPLARRTGLRGINDPVAESQLDGAPVITLSDGDRVSLGQGHLVYIDRGAADDVYPGDIFTIYRRNRRGLPPMVVGELAVLSVEDRTALAKILESRFAIFVGDRLSLK